MSRTNLMASRAVVENGILAVVTNGSTAANNSCTAANNSCTAPTGSRKSSDTR